MNALLEYLKLPEDRNALLIPNNSGHETVVYDPTDPVQVAEVKEVFDQMVGGLKMTGLRNPHLPEEAEVTREFDPEARVMELKAQNAGG